MFHSEEIKKSQEEIEQEDLETVEKPEEESNLLKVENQQLKQKVRQLTGENNRWEKKISNLNKKISFWENQDLISDSLDKIKIKEEFKSYFAKEVIKKDENFYNSLKENKLDDYFKSLKSNKSFSPFFDKQKDDGIVEDKQDDIFLNSLPPQKKVETDKDIANKLKKLFTKQ